MKVTRLGRPSYRKTMTPAGKVSWQLYYTEQLADGRKYRRFRKGFPTRGLAEAYFRSIESAAKDGTLTIGSTATPPPASTLKELVSLYIENSAGKSPSAIQRDSEALSRFAEFTGDIPITTITPLLIDKFLTHRQAAGRAPSTINRELSVIRTLFNRAVRWELVRANPTAGIKKLKQPEKPVVYLERDELRSLLAACSSLAGSNSRTSAPHLRPLVALAAYTGLRRGELFNLRWRNIDVESKVLNLENTDDWTTKSGRGRVIGLSPGAIKELEDWKQWFRAEIGRAQERASDRKLHKKSRDDAARRLIMLRDRERRPDRLVFPSWKPNANGEPLPLDNVDSSLKAAVKKSDIKRKAKVTMHALRHTFGVMLARQGTPLVQISHLLGHADLSTTQIYLRFSPDEGVMASSKLPDLAAQPAAVVDIADATNH